MTDDTNRILQTAVEKAGSERELARRLGVSNQAVNSWVNDKYTPTYETIQDMIAKLTFGLNVAKQLLDAKLSSPVQEN